MESVPSYDGPPLFSFGFRPFFLLGAVYAGFAILVWLPVFMGELKLVSTFHPRDWHVHEMLYGFLPAVITGFLFTAIPNWTGRLPLRGRPLMFLVILWIAGRACITLSTKTGWLTAMLVDCSFLFMIASAAAREIIAGKKWNNLGVIALISLLLSGNVVFHLEVHFNGTADYSVRVGVGVVVLLISLIGGRIIPSFTRNWLVKNHPGRLPIPFARFDRLCILAGTVALIFWVISPTSVWTGYALVYAGAMHLVRLARWAGDRTIHERLLLILHVGYAFVPIGFLLTAGRALGDVPASAGIHAWMGGAAGIMTLAVMSRASLGHTGQELHAAPTTQVIFALIVIAVLARICAVFEPSLSVQLLHVATLAWTAAFLGFALCYGPALFSVKKNTHSS